MKKPIVDHVWHKIVENGALSKEMCEQKIIEFRDLYKKVEREVGCEAAENIFGNGLIDHSLNRCLDYLNSDPSICTNDFRVFYEFASGKMSSAEEAIDKELPLLVL